MMTKTKLESLIKEFKAFPATVRVYDEETYGTAEIKTRDYVRLVDPYDGLYRYFEDGDTREEGFDMKDLHESLWLREDVAELITADGRTMIKLPAPVAE
jgi:hypothetical protein